MVIRLLQQILLEAEPSPRPKVELNSVDFMTVRILQCFGYKKGYECHVYGSTAISFF